MFSGHGSCIFPGRYESFRVGNSVLLFFFNIINSVFFFLLTCSYLILCSKKVGNRTQTVVNSTQVASGEASRSRLSIGFFCVSVTILVTSTLLPFW